MAVSYPYTKKQLASDLNWNIHKLTRELLILEPELLVKFPHYNRNRQILGRRIYEFLLSELGGFDSEIETIEQFRSNFGVK